MAVEAHEDVDQDVMSHQDNTPLLHAHDEPFKPQAKDIWLEVRLLLKQCPPLAWPPQSYGSGDIHTVGMHVQRMVLLMELVCVPIAAFWIASPFLLSFFVKQPHLALKAGTFLRMSAIGLPAQALFEAARRFLQVQGDFHTAMLMIALCTPVNALLSWTLAFSLGMGLDGAALGSSPSQILRAALLLLNIASARGRWFRRCWGGFSRDALRGWGLMARLSVAGSVATLSEYAAFETLCFSTSYLSTKRLAAQSILTTTTIFVWHVPFSISVFIV
ncbi:putative transporter [Colletotrichum aenigma]|uniref:putative transporter n=1 Tax=Colletotrichum aenigma TaxID=1215731 RepID=UPI0018732E66|nr:putative transporter [Colletotrichum aenigma]KAF5528625.1 putative transporter [Colletotrichum aenigma]